MIIEKSLLEAGYKKHVSSTYEAFKCTDTLYQKRITDSNGTKYFVNAWYYAAQPYANEGVQFEVQFYNRNDEVEMDVSLFTNDVNVAESKFDLIWLNMNLGYAEKEDDN